MQSNSKCDQDKQGSEGPMFRNEYRTIEKRDPDHADGYDLHMKRYRLMYKEIADIRS